MSPIAAGSAIGAAALTIGRGVLDATASGLSFAAELAKSTSGAKAAAVAKTDQQNAARELLDQRIEALRHRITRHLAQCGIDLAEPLELISDRLGGIDLATPHPQETAIKEALSRDILLERDFNQLLSDASELSPTSGSNGALTAITIPGRREKTNHQQTTNSF